MSRDVTLGDDPSREARDAEPYPHWQQPGWEPVVEPPTLLDRTLELPADLARWAVAAVALLLAVLLRFLGLDRFPLTVEEARIADLAHRLVRGESLPDTLHGVPTAIHWTALFFFGGASQDSVARLAMAVAGVGALLLTLALGRVLGARWAAAAAVLMAVSPTLIVASRRVDGGALLVTLTLAVVLAVRAGCERPGIGWPLVAGAATGALVLAHPLGIPAALLAWLAAWLVVRERWSGTLATERLLAAVAAALAAVVLLATAFLTRPESFAAALGENLDRLVDEHLSEFGGAFWMPTFNLILNEPLLLALALVGWFASPLRALTRALALWFVAAFVVVSLLGGPSVGGYALVVLPLALLAGTGALQLVERVPWRELRRGPGLLYMLAVLLSGFALVSLIGLVAHGVGDDALEWLLTFALIVVLVILPLSLTISSLGLRVAGSRLVLVLATVVVVLGALTARSATLAASERQAVPGEPLAAGITAGDVPVVLGRVMRLSRDLTMAQRSSQDPTGGHGLAIAIDAEVREPFAWYFRDFPNVTVFDPDSEPLPVPADLVILAGDRDAQIVAPGYSGQPYPFDYAQPAIYDDPDWADLLSGIVDPDAWRRFAEFVLYREPAAAPAERSWQLLATGDVATRLFPSSGPYTLFDRPGAGQGQGQLNRPRGIAVSPVDGSIYVVDTRNSRVQRFAATGEFLQAWGSEGSGPGQFGRFATAGGGGANGIAVGPDGTVYVADTWNHRIQVFSADGTWLREWGSFFDAQDDPTQASANPGVFYGPRGIVVGTDGNVYVTDTGNERVQVFTTDGEYVRMFGTAGSGENQLLEPVGIALALDGTVLVADSHNARIARFTPEGEWLEPYAVQEWTGLQFFEPYLAVAPDGAIYATTSVDGNIAVLADDGTPGVPTGGSELRQPFGIAVASDGTTLLVTDGSLHAVVTIPITVE